MLGARGGAPTGKRNGNYRHGKRTKEVIQAVRYINLLSRLARRSREGHASANLYDHPRRAKKNPDAGRNDFRNRLSHQR
jgi:hypothetical protein